MGRHKLRIKDALKKIHCALESRGNLAAPIIESYCEMIESRMRGQIRSTIISPAISGMVSSGFNMLGESIISQMESGTLIEEARLLPDRDLSGISAGDAVDEEIKHHANSDPDSSDDEDWSQSNLASRDEFGHFLRVEDGQEPHEPATILNTEFGPVIIPSSAPMSFDPEQSPGLEFRFSSVIEAEFLKMSDEDLQQEYSTLAGGMGALRPEFLYNAREIALSLAYKARFAEQIGRSFIKFKNIAFMSQFK